MKTLQHTLTLLLMTLSSVMGFSTTNVDLLYGSFDDNSYVYDVKDRGKSTLTLAHYRTFSHGDLYFFTDLARADKRFQYQDKRHDWYFEVSPRIALTPYIPLKSAYIKNIYFASQYNHGEDNYKAVLLGGGVGLNFPHFQVLDLNLYRKDQSVGDNTTQLSLNYTVPFAKDWRFEGFTDWTEDDLLSQNQLMFWVKRNIAIGTEWHYYKQKASDVKGSTWQLMVKFQW
jgi:nucleoside-specific outer membrane channel protein Tsx